MPQCKGFTKNGIRCQKEITQGDYCWQHETVSKSQVGGFRFKRFRRDYEDPYQRIKKTTPELNDDPIVKSLTCTCDCEGNISQDELMEAMQASGVLGSSPMSQFGTSSRASNFISVAPNVSFNGQCEEAFKFYEKVFGGKITTMMKYSALPKTGGLGPSRDSFSKDYQNKVVHASIKIGDTELMGSDTPPDEYVVPRGFHILVNLDDPKKAEKIFRTLATGGQIMMPLERTSWADRFGTVTDKFGIPWMINSGSSFQK